MLVCQHRNARSVRERKVQRPLLILAPLFFMINSPAFGDNAIAAFPRGGAGTKGEAGASPYTPDRERLFQDFQLAEFKELFIPPVGVYLKAEELILAGNAAQFGTPSVIIFMRQFRCRATI